jgi:hypothetical protein
MKIPDHRHRSLLRSRGQRPYYHCDAAEKPDEFPPPHGIYTLAENHLFQKSNTIFKRELCTASQLDRRADVRFSNRPFGVKHFQTVHVAVC